MSREPTVFNIFFFFFLFTFTVGIEVSRELVPDGFFGHHRWVHLKVIHLGQHLMGKDPRYKVFIMVIFPELSNANSLRIQALDMYDWPQEAYEGKIHGKLNASWKISSLAVNGQSFLVIDGYLLDFL